MSLIKNGLFMLSTMIAASALPAAASGQPTPAANPADCPSGFISLVTGDQSKPAEATCLSPQSNNRAFNTDQVFTVNLPANAGTGGAWALRQMPASVMLLGIGQQPSPDCKEGMVGCKGITSYTFKAVAAGSGKLEFMLGRPWEKDAWQTISIQLNVR